MTNFDDMIKEFPNLHNPHLNSEFKKQIIEKYGDCVYDEGLIYNDFLYKTILPLVETRDWTKELLEKYNGIPDLYVYTGADLFPYEANNGRLIFGWGLKDYGWNLERKEKNDMYGLTGSHYSGYCYMMNGDIVKPDVFNCKFDFYNRSNYEDDGFVGDTFDNSSTYRNDMHRAIYNFNGFYHNYVPVGAIPSGKYPSVNNLETFGYIIL